MTLDGLKQEVERRAGVPAALLKGETIEEVISTAKALIAYRRECAPKCPKSHEELFAEWFNKMRGIEERDETGVILAKLEEQARAEAGGYTMASPAREQRPAREQFSEWLKNNVNG